DDVVGDRVARLLDLQLDLTVGLDAPDAELPEGAQCIYRFVADLQHRASLCGCVSSSQRTKRSSGSTCATCSSAQCTRSSPRRATARRLSLSPGSTSPSSQ